MASIIAQNRIRTIGYFLKDFIYLFIFRERKREGESEGEKHQFVRKTLIASCPPPTGDPAHKPGMCPDRELNQRLYGSQAITESTEPHQ